MFPLTDKWLKTVDMFLTNRKNDGMFLDAFCEQAAGDGQVSLNQRGV